MTWSTPSRLEVKEQEDTKEAVVEVAAVEANNSSSIHSLNAKAAAAVADPIQIRWKNTTTYSTDRTKDAATILTTMSPCRTVEH